MDLQSLHKKLLPCDVNSPYIFISYSSEDKEIVWTDIVELQSRGYNLWIDEPNLDKTKESWELDALHAIESCNCILLAFYISEHSLFSKACLEELERTRGKLTNETHFGNVDFIAIECEQIDHIGEYVESLKRQTENSNIDQEEKNNLLRILYNFNKRWFTSDNKKVRVRSKSILHRHSDYYGDIEKEFCGHQRGGKLRSEKSYRFAIENLIQGKLYEAMRFLTIIADFYVPAALLLSHFLRNSTENLDREKAERLWTSVEHMIPSDTWGKRGIDEEKKKCYSEAIAWLLAYGEKYNNPEYIYKAGQNWARKGCKEQTISVLRIAASMEYEKAREFLSKLMMKSPEDFLSKACKDELPL